MTIQSSTTTRRAIVKYAAGLGLAAPLMIGHDASLWAQEASPTSGTPVIDVTWPRVSDRIPYGDDDPVKQALYVWELEPRASPRPALVFIHGGALMFGDAEDAVYLLEDYAAAGYVTFAIGYRLFTPGDSPVNLWPTQIDDVQLAMRWIRQNAARFNVDPNRVCVMGHSSGGQLAGLLGTLDTVDDGSLLYPEQSSRASCVISVSGDLDIRLPYTNPSYTDLNTLIFGGSLEELPTVYEEASAAAQVDADTVPFLIIHSPIDGDTPIAQARSMLTALGEAGIHVVYAEFPSQTHAGILFHKPVRLLISAFLEWQLHPDV